jgi:hypothetical protein
MKAPTCRAILTTHGGSATGGRPGQRCCETATEPASLPQLCWVHARALAFRDRPRPLELVAVTIRERAELEAWKAAQAAKVAGK